MGTNECSELASNSSWDSQDFDDVSMVLKWPIFASPPGHNELNQPLQKHTYQWTMHKFTSQVAYIVLQWLL